MTRDRDTYPVRWMGGRAIVTVPEQIDVSNAGQIREELLTIINRGAAELITDMTETTSCDYAGADAVVRAYQRAVVSGTQLRLVVAAPMVRRVLAVNGLDRLIPVYPSLEAAVAAGTQRQEAQTGPASATIVPAVSEVAGLPRSAGQADRAEELLDWVVSSIFDIGVSLQAATDLLQGTAAVHVADALDRLDDVVREVRHHLLAEHAPAAQSGFARRPTPDLRERLAQAAHRRASVNECVMQTAYALQTAAADTAALLEQQADIVGQPGRIDYPTEIKRWRAFADQASQMAKRWEQRP